MEIARGDPAVKPPESIRRTSFHTQHDSFISAARLIAGVGGVGEHVAQPRMRALDRGQQDRCAIAILHARFVHNRAHQQAGRVGEDVTFAALHLLSGIEPARAAGFRRLHRLAVDYARGRAGLAAVLLARLHHQHVGDLAQQDSLPWPPFAWSLMLASRIAWYSGVSGAFWPRPAGLV